MILHLFNDEKIINRMIENFESVLPEQNIYVCLVPETEYQYVHLDDNVHRIIKYKEGDLLNFDPSSITKVFIHYLTIEKIRFCERYIPTSAEIYWGSWGGDLYNILLFSRGYKLYSSFNYKYNIIESIIGYLKILKHKLVYDEIYLKFINSRVSYIGGAKCDFDLVNKYILTSPKKHFNIPGYGIDEVLGPTLINSYINKNSNIILCSNSASYTNNHRYAIDYIKKIINKDSIIKMVLSYSGDRNYVQKIIKYGTKHLGHQFHAITNFLPLEEYNDLQCSAHICVYTSWRQEALGNILVSLYLGAKVYLSRHSPLLDELRTIGYKIYVLEDATQKSFYSKIDTSDQIINRSLVLEHNNKQLILDLINKHFR